VTSLPPAREPGRYRIAVVCLGNICRSPVADVVLTSLVADAGLGDQVEIRSSGTGAWHVGEAMDRRAAGTLTTAGYDPSRHGAKKFDPGSLADLDLVLAMDGANLADIRASVAALGDGAVPPGATTGGGDADRIRLFREFDPVEPGGEVPDPYYGGHAGFEEVLTMVERTAAAIVAELRKECTTGTTAP
jgi:protein-tyrosine phosphatase